MLTDSCSLVPASCTLKPKVAASWELNAPLFCLQGVHHPSRLPGAVREWLHGQYIPFQEPVPGTLQLQL